MPHAQFALVLTAKPGAGALEEATATSVRALLADPAHAQARWLAPGEAWEAVWRASREEDLEPLAARIEAALGERPVDINILAADPRTRRKRLLVADMESTIIEQECLDELAGYVGQRERIAGITARAMHGELDFEAALKERVGLLKGLDAAALDDLYARVTLVPGAETLIGTMKAHGAVCALVSGGFTYFTERIAGRLGFDTQQANTLQIEDGKLAGSVAMPILGREAKLSALRRLRDEMGLTAEETMAVGDGANDLAMIKAAGLGVAFRAKPIVAAEAGARIRHGDLTALLYLQGYQRSEFAVA